MRHVALFLSRLAIPVVARTAAALPGRPSVRRCATRARRRAPRRAHPVSTRAGTRAAIGQIVGRQAGLRSRRCATLATAHDAAAGNASCCASEFLSSPSSGQSCLNLGLRSPSCVTTGPSPSFIRSALLEPLLRSPLVRDNRLPSIINSVSPACTCLL